MPADNSSKGSSEARSELNEPVWSVVSFERCEASGLTYDAAVSRISQLDAAGVPGLCIVSDEAAGRVAASSKVQ